jgi:dihydroorotase
MPVNVHLLEVPEFDLIIFGGRVIDPANGIDSSELDVGVRGGVIAAVAKDLPRAKAKQLHDAKGNLIVPGLIDTHVHVFDGVAPYGMDADEYCLSRGSTTVLDAGDAGCNSLVRRLSLCRPVCLLTLLVQLLTYIASTVDTLR